MLDGHTVLDIQCLDRVYLNVYVPILQTSSQVVAFLSSHLGYPFASPALFNNLDSRPPPRRQDHLWAAATPACPTSTSSNPRPAPATSAYWKPNTSVTAASSRVQPSSGSRTPPPTRKVAGPQPYGSAILGVLTGALCQTLLAATGFSNKSPRALIAGLLGSDYRPGQMTYDLRLRLSGPSAGSHIRAGMSPSPMTAPALRSCAPKSTTECWPGYSTVKRGDGP